MWISGRHFNNRAVSEVIASLLLVALAVSAAIIVYVYSIGLVGGLQTSGGEEVMSLMNLTSTTATTTISSTSSVSPRVGIYYSGPYPLNPSTSATPGTLTTSFIIGNPAADNQPEIYQITITSTAGFASYFTLTVSTSSFTIQSGTRQNIVVYANYKPGSVPAGQYTASIYVVGSALSYPTGSSPGHAGYTCPVVITVQPPGL